MSKIGLSRQEHLERLFQRYSYLPKEAVIKEDILTQGLAADATVRASLSGKALCLEGGLYGLQRTIVRADWRQGSPYLLVPRDSQWAVVDRASNAPLAPARPFPQTPAGLDRCWEVMAADGEVMTNRRCQLQDTGMGCVFCNLDGAAGSPHTLAPNDVAATVAEVFLYADWSPREKPLHLNLNGGSISQVFEGQTEAEFYLKYVRGIKQAVENRYPLLLQMFPKPALVEQSLYQEGVNVRLSNLEVWDRRLFSAFCPGKDRLVGWEEWVRRLLDQVYIYGDGRVLPAMVTGLEMLPPWGLSSLNEAVKSTTEGFQFLMSHGVIPLPIHLSATKATAHAPPLPVELFLEIDCSWYETWYFYRLCEPMGFNVGPGRNRFPHSAAFDVGRGAKLK